MYSYFLMSFEIPSKTNVIAVNSNTQLHRIVFLNDSNAYIGNPVIP